MIDIINILLVAPPFDFSEGGISTVNGPLFSRYGLIEVDGGTAGQIQAVADTQDSPGLP